MLKIGDFYLLAIIRYTGSKFWNEMPEKIKSSLSISYTTFVLHVKEFLKSDQ